MGEPNGDGMAGGDGRRIALGLALVVTGLPLAAWATFPLVFAFAGDSDDSSTHLAMIGVAALIPGVLLVVIGLVVLVRRPGRRGPLDSEAPPPV